jgi:outer membrane receptor protein involved in Fe transport
VQSILPSEMIDSIEFIPGGFDVQYGRSTGGVINIHVRPSRADQWTGFAELSFINAGGYIEGPVSRAHHIRLTAAFRRSVIDALLPLALSDSDHLSFTTNPQYYDGQLRLDWSPGDHDDVSLIGFTSWDFAAAGIGQENALDPNASGSFSNRVGFTRVAPSWHHHDHDLEVFARTWIGDAHFNYSEGTGLFENASGWIYGGRGDVGYRLAPWLKLRGGGELQIYHLTADARFTLPPVEGQPGMPNSTTEQQVTLTGYALQQDTAGSYAAADLSLGTRVTVTPGIRYDRYISIDRTTWSPRATANVELTPEWTARATVGRYTRPPNGLEALDLKLDAEHAIHYVAGAEYQPAEGITATTNVFYNDLDNLVTYDPTLVKSSPVDGYVNRGTGHAYGVEAMLRVQRSDWFAWVTYTLSHSVRRDGPGLPLRLFDYDQPNNLIVVVSRKLGRWRLGGRFQVTTGEPTTPLQGSIYNSNLDVYLPQYGQVDSIRKEAAHQLDLRVDREWQLQGWKLSVFLDVTNLYDHRRVTGYNYDFNYGQRSAITTFPIFPAAGVRGTF